MPNPIPQKIDDEEKIVRCIGHEIFFSKRLNRITSPAFLPPKGSNEVSVLRLNYSNETKCKAHGKSLKIGNYNYCGLSRTLAKHLILKETEYMIDENTPAETTLIASPLDEELQLREDIKDITDEDPGLPFHADLVYNWTPEEGKTAPSAIKRIAKKLAKNPPTDFFQDTDIENEEWIGDPL
ncbi:MAG: hypothetical protein JJ876_04155 [Muricauda sp.]|nr:hypothetical protein [Allomuricauda sp.]MBO6828735.1 hypothetical protein [Allomuricauda sp.]